MEWPRSTIGSPALKRLRSTLGSWFRISSPGLVPDTPLIPCGYCSSAIRGIASFGSWGQIILFNCLAGVIGRRLWKWCRSPYSPGRAIRNSPYSAWRRIAIGEIACQVMLRRGWRIGKRQPGSSCIRHCIRHRQRKSGLVGATSPKIHHCNLSLISL